MKTIGFINSHKENEKRIALLPQDLSNSLDLTSNLYFEEGYGTQLGIKDAQYLETGAYITPAGISQIPQGIYFTEKKPPLSGRQKRFLFWSRVRESNPPSRLGKPLYYRYTNPAER